MLDLMRYFSGENFIHINSFVTTSYWNIESEDNAFAIIQSKDKVTASLHSSATQWKHKFLLEMCFEQGYVNLDGILSGTRSYAPEKLVVGRREFEDITHAMGKPKENTTWFENDDSWELEVDEFIDPCGHSFCNACKDRLIEYEGGITDANCPTCRGFIRDFKPLYL